MFFGKKVCVPQATLYDPYDNFTVCSNNTRDYSKFKTVDLTQLGGGITAVTDDASLRQAFLNLGYLVNMDTCDIIIYSTELCDDQDCKVEFNLPVYGYVKVNLITSCSGNIDYGTFDAIDLSQYGGNSYVEVSSNNDIINALFTLGYTSYIDGCDIIIESNTQLPNIPVRTQGSFTLIDTDEGIIPCDGEGFDYSQFDAVDMSAIGLGNVPQPVTSDASLKFVLEFGSNLQVEIDGCNIIVLNNPFDFEIPNMEVCRHPRIQLVDNVSDGIIPCVDDTIDFNAFTHIDFSPYGGGFEQISTPTQLINRLKQLTSSSVVIEGCTIRIKNCSIPEYDLEVTKLTQIPS